MKDRFYSMSISAKTSIAFLVIFLGVLFVFGGGSVNALSRRFPTGGDTDDQHMSRRDSNGVNTMPRAMVTHADNVLVTLQADKSKFNIFYRTTGSAISGSGSVQIVLNDICRPAGALNQIGNTAARVTVRNLANTWSRQSDNFGASNRCNGDDIIINVPKWVVRGSSSVGNYTNDWRVLRLVVDKRSGAIGITNFQVVANGGLVTYMEETAAQRTGRDYTSGRAFSLWNGRSYNNGSNPSTRNMTFKFAPNCNIGAGTGREQVYLKWHDADHGAFNQPSRISFTLSSRARGSSGGWTNVFTENGSTGIGGNGADRRHSFTADERFEYKWEWHNVNRINGIQVWMPYSEVQTRITCPSTANISAIAGPDRVINKGDVADFTASVTGSNLARVGTDEVRYRVSGYAPVSDTDVRISNLPINANHNGAMNALGRYCRTITIISAPTYANITRRSDEQCVFVQGADIIPTTAMGAPGGFVNAGEHEKGSGDKTVQHGVAVGSIVCTAAVPVPGNVPVPVYKRYGGGSQDLVGNVVMPNCQSIGVNLLVNGPPIASATLDGFNPGDLHPVQTIITVLGNTYTNSKSIEVIEAPFARFFGNDVLVCGNANNNRFVYDNRELIPGVTINRAGSISQYASIFGDNNSLGNTANSFNDYSGLLPNNGGYKVADNSVEWWNILRSNWVGITCESGLEDGDIPPTATGGSYPRGNINDSVTYVHNSGVTLNINQNIRVNQTAGPDNYAVVIIKADNINITKDVTQIDAILIAEDSTGALGTINTCSNVDKDMIHRMNGNVGCRKPLRINGAVYASELKLRRAGSTRYYADNLGGDRVLANSLAPLNLDIASETINYPWQLHFAKPDLLDNSEAGGFDAYFARPPRL